MRSLSAFLPLIFIQASLAQLLGPLSGTLGPGSYTVVDTIWVDSGSTLRLLPGTTFSFEGPFPFRIFGTLLAEGTQNDSIVFSTDTLLNPNRWRGLRFSGSSSSGGRLVYCLIENGYATGGGESDRYGGGVRCESGASPSFTHCTIRDNRAEDGGGVECENSSPTFARCFITGNSASDDGGGVSIAWSLATFTDCIIADNSAGAGGGIRVAFEPSPTFTHCTITANSSLDEGEGLTSWWASAAVVNCIVTGLHNEAVSFFFDNSGSHFEHCCILRHGGTPFNSPDGAGGPPSIGRLVATNANGDSCDIYGNIYLGPLFLDPLAGDFHLSDWSPCIGAGQAGSFDEDIDGNPRPNPPGSLPDIGAYENSLAAPIPYQGLSGTLNGILGPGIYRIAGTISVNAGATLRLLPGTTFLFGGPFPFEVYGTLLAEGTASDSILFTSDGPMPEPWRGVRFHGSSTSGTFSYCIFEYGYAAGGDSADHGGAVYCSRASLSFDDCRFRYNRARGLGGAVYCGYAAPPFVNCTFQANLAYGGGAVCCENSSPTLTDCSFLGNSVSGATSYGGALCCLHASPRLTNCLLEGNYSESYAGGVYCEDHASPTFTTCIFSNNLASDRGGAVYCETNSSPVLTNCTLAGNQTRTGGAVCCFGGSSPRFTDCVLSGNTVYYEGAGIYCAQQSSPNFTRCTISVNSASWGAGVYCRESSPNFTNCTLSGNLASRIGGGVYFLSSSPVLNSTTIAFSGGEAIYFQNSAGSQIHHCDFFGNTGGSFTFYNNDSSQGPPQIGELDTTNANGDSCDTFRNIFLDPEFISSDDFHLQASSPCIDAGDPSLPLDPDTTVADIGAFYFDQSAAEPPVIIVPTAYALHPNWPNPFNSSTMIRYDVPQSGRVSLTIFNLLGQSVATLFDGRQLAGSYNIAWDAANLPSGVYLCCMEAPGFMQTRKMLLVK
jgi:predicted outer membrane repeat protein